MSKAEEAACKAYPYNRDYRGQGDSNSKFREAYINGYHQAERELALTWEEMVNKAWGYISNQLNLPSDFEQHFSKAMEK
jgi:hypothetical protein